MEKFTLMSCLLAGSQTKLMAYFITGSVFEKDLCMCSDKVRESYKSESGSLLQYIFKANNAVSLSDIGLCFLLQVVANTSWLKGRSN